MGIIEYIYGGIIGYMYGDYRVYIYIYGDYRVNILRLYHIRIMEKKMDTTILYRAMGCQLPQPMTSTYNNRSGSGSDLGGLQGLPQPVSSCDTASGPKTLYTP